MDEEGKTGRESEHTEKIRKLFSEIAQKYDSINRQQSFRRDIAWRRFTARKMRFFQSMRYLDVATGTADLALDVARQHRNIKVVGLDISEELLEIGKEKIEREGLSNRIQLMTGNALDLPFEDKSFDASGIAFGIRNINDRLHALREMRRVVVPGGQVHVLELSFHGTGLFKPLYYCYLKMVIPFMARLVASNREAYEYMGKSIMAFPAPDDFCAIMREAGLVNTQSYPLTLGVARLFTGTRPV